MEGLLHYWFGGLIFGGAYFWNFTVTTQDSSILGKSFNYPQVAPSPVTKELSNRILRKSFTYLPVAENKGPEAGLSLRFQVAR